MKDLSNYLKSQIAKKLNKLHNDKEGSQKQDLENINVVLSKDKRVKERESEVKNQQVKAGQRHVLAIEAERERKKVEEKLRKLKERDGLRNLLSSPQKSPLVGGC